MRHQGEELVARFFTLAKTTEHSARDRSGMLLFNAAHHHAEMLCFEDDGYSLRMNGVGDGFADLAGEAFLDLQTTREDIDEAGDFAESDDFAVGNVGDVSFSEEGQEMMLALGEEFDVFYDDHLVVVDVEESFVENLGHIHRVAAGEKCHGLFHALGCAEEAVACGVFSDAEKQFAIEVLR